MTYQRGSFRKADLNGNGQSTLNASAASAAQRNVDTGTRPYSAANAPEAAGTRGSPGGVLIGVLILLVLLRFAAAKTGDQAEFGAVAPTFFNVMVITLAAILGLTLLKALAVKFLPANIALRQIILAA